MERFRQTILTTAAFLFLAAPAFAKDKCEEVKTSDYEGTVCDGKYHGEGLQFKSDGSKHYRGSFVEGKYEGTGTLFLSDGRLEASFRNGKIEGPGKIILEDGHLFFDGSYKKNYKSGFGKSYYVNGGTYVGEYKNDLYHGQGELLYRPNTEKSFHYVGSFKYGEFDGQGEIKGSNNYSYVGGFKAGVFHGDGVGIFEASSDKDLIKRYGEDYASLNPNMTSVSAVRYEGEYKKGNRSGLGKMEYSNGDTYAGLFKAGQPTENGKHFDKDGNLSSKYLIAEEVRVPVVPRRAKKSGYCTVDFDINTLGETENIKIASCSDDVYKKASLRNVKKTKFYPKMENGVAVPRVNWRKRIRFSLTDEFGRYIPE